ncbi:YkvA family protein [Amnibacterium endophyticum]|uniref:YkvA family protein n=1 Tax=Amnibacterium endophyticum TaxID=2109337 RepID=A0ABW4LKX1_9MICO
MTDLIGVLLAVLSGLVVFWLLLLLAALAGQARRHGDRIRLQELLRLVPDVVRLLGRLIRDRGVPWRVRVVLLLLLAYLASPIDLVSDVLPVVGYADDALVVALALRFAVRQAGRDVLERAWPGTDAGLPALLRLAGIRDEGG